MRDIYRTCAFALFLLATPVSAEQTGVVMRDVYDAIAYLLPLSVRGDEARSPWDKELVDAKLEILQSAAATLVEHAQSEDSEFKLLARSFDRLVRDTAASFREQWPDYAYYSLMELTDHCVACHSRLPSDSQQLFGQRLIARMVLDDVPPESKALLLVATRQFDAALELLEQRLLDGKLDPIEADYRGIMVRYLRIAISVPKNTARVKTFLARYRAREDLPFYLDRRLAHWETMLTELADSLDAQPDLDRARTIFDQATARTLAPGNRLRAAEDLLAARLFRTFLAVNPNLDAATRAEIYFKLAIISLRTSEPDPGVPEMEILLAAAIDADPAGPHALEAYSLLEEYGYIHEEHLARQLETRIMIDMQDLRERVETATRPH